jgi:hypothetical protein
MNALERCRTDGMLKFTLTLQYSRFCLGLAHLGGVADSVKISYDEEMRGILRNPSR